MVTPNNFHPESVMNMVVNFDVERTGDCVGETSGLNHFDINHRLFVLYLHYCAYFIVLSARRGGSHFCNI